MSEPIYTIGYGNRAIDEFLRLIRTYAIEVVADVRSLPYSSRYGDFNREALQHTLKSKGVKYVFLGNELGARPTDDAMYENGRASYALMAESRPFAEGLRRVIEGAQRYRVALMCAEKDPIDCHRAILISRALERDRLRVSHIAPDGDLESHVDLEERLLRKVGLLQSNLFEETDRTSALGRAYTLRSSQLAYDRNVGDEQTWR